MPRPRILDGPIRLPGALAIPAALLVVAACGESLTFRTVDRERPGSVSGRLLRPAGPGPSPAVVLLHGGTGLEPNHGEWAAWLAGEGYVALLVDSVGFRGIPSADTMAGDALGALDHLRGLPFVGRDRVAVIGFSRGGTAALTATTMPPDGRPAARGFRAAVAFYPSGCSYRIARSEAPLLLLLGGQDGSPEPCLDLRARLQAAGSAPVTVVVYPGAYHAFDDARATTLVTNQGAERAMTVKYDGLATAAAHAQVRRFLATHLRGGRRAAGSGPPSVNP